MTQYGQYTSLIQSIKGNANGTEPHLGPARGIDVYNRSKTFGGAPPLPVTSSTSDITSFIRAMTAGQSDIAATLTTVSIPFLYANIFGFSRETQKDLYSNIIPTVPVGSVDLYSSIKGVCSTSTGPLTYTNIIIGTTAGAVVLRRYITKLPDITASLYGWDYLDLGAEMKIYQRSALDLEAVVGSVAQTASNILATIIATYTEDFTASLTTIPYSVLTGTVTPVPPLDLLGNLVPVPPHDLLATGGGHYPEDISGYLQTIQPYPITAFIRSGYSTTSDVSADVTGSGGYSDIVCRVNSLQSDVYSLRAALTVKISYDLRARIHAWDLLNLSASVTGVRTSIVRAFIRGQAIEEVSDLDVFIRSAFGGTSDLSVDLHGWISAHTSDKLYNYNLLPRPARTIFLAHTVGLTMMQIEPIRGNFPDLHATITGTPFSVYDLRAFVRPLLRTTADISANVNAVTSVINITKIPIEFSNVSDLSVYISAFSGYSPITGRIIGNVSTNTTTAPGSGWVYISSSINFYLGTNKGLFIPSRVERVVRPERFNNSSQNPDLWAYLQGWATSDLGASLTVYPNLALGASITGQDLSHIKSLTATIVSTYVNDLVASITGHGEMVSLSADITASGYTSELSASIRPYLKLLGFRLIPVETMPFSELKAVVNPISSCEAYSGYQNISAFVRGTVPSTSGSDLQASIVSLRDVLSLGATIVGRKITKIKTIGVWFRSQTRRSSPITSLCVGVGTGTNDVGAYIKGIPHTDDIGATITAFRHAFNKIPSVETIKVYKDYFTNVEIYKTIEMYFSSSGQKYIYDALNSALYRTEGDRWVLNLSEITDTGEFFDRDVNDITYPIDSLVEYDSIDEAIRAAISILTEWRTSDLSASIVATGGYKGLGATIGALQPHRHLDLPASLYIVNNLPVLYASITAYSGYNALSADINGQGHGPAQIDADIIGVTYDSIGASVTGVI